MYHSKLEQEPSAFIKVVAYENLNTMEKARW